MLDGACVVADKSGVRTHIPVGGVACLMLEPGTRGDEPEKLSMDWHDHDRIESDPQICGGRPRVKGTRLAVEFLLGLKAAGWTDAQILDSYPHLKAKDLRAVFALAQSLIEETRFLPLPRVT